jgi:transcriptional regulator GlxA family with amidase domain
MQIAIPLFDGFTATDAIGPYEVLSRLPEADVRFVASQPGSIASDTGFLRVEAQALTSAARPTVIVVPGGPNRALPLEDQALMAWLKEADRHSTWTCSVCTGALLLGAAGLLRGCRATTHWMDHGLLPEHGVQPVPARYVFDGKYVTAAGISAGYDMALALAARISGDDAARAIQLHLEYDPAPPFDAGSPEKAGPATTARVRAAAASRR